MVRTLDDAEIARVLTYERLIPAMELALTAFSSGKVTQPVRSVIPVEPGQRYLGVMPAVMSGSLGAKLVCFYPKNAAAGLPTHLATIVLFESETGHPLACLDGRRITEMRTGRFPRPSPVISPRPVRVRWRCSGAACRHRRISRHCVTSAASRTSGCGAATRTMLESSPPATARGPWKRRQRCATPM